MSAKCAEIGGEAWFPKSKGSPAKEARAICLGNEAKGIPACPVLDLCREYAVENHINYGIWGGTSPRERVAIRRTRGIAELELELEDEDELDTVEWAEVDFQDAL